MKKVVCAAIAAIMLASVNVSAQDDANAGIIVDGVKVDKIDCWSFEKMDLVFPLDKEKWNQYDLVTIALLWDNDTEFNRKFTKEKANEYFGNSKYGVWKFLRNKATDRVESTDAYYGGTYVRKSFADYSKDGSTLRLQVTGFAKAGVNENGSPTYSNPVTLYKSNVVNLTKSKYKEDLPCAPSGTKLDLTIEPAGGYDEEFGVIK